MPSSLIIGTVSTLTATCRQMSRSDWRRCHCRYCCANRSMASCNASRNTSSVSEVPKMKQPLSKVLAKGTYTIDDVLQLTVGRHGRFLNFATDQIGIVLSLYGEWAEPETRLLTALVNPGDTVLDVGAHI